MIYRNIYYHLLFYLSVSRLKNIDKPDTATGFYQKFWDKKCKSFDKLCLMLVFNCNISTICLNWQHAEKSKIQGENANYDSTFITKHLLNCIDDAARTWKDREKAVILAVFNVVRWLDVRVDLVFTLVFTMVHFTNHLNLFIPHHLF